MPDLGLPSGTVTFLFSDIEGSTRLWESHTRLMQASLARHDSIMRKAITAAHGYVFKTVGDAFCAAFATAPTALEAAVNCQLALLAEPWPNETPIKVRISLHTGAVESRDEDYFGPTVNRVARLLSTAHGGQTLLSQTTFDLVRDLLPRSTSLRDLGSHRLKDLERPERVYQVQNPRLADDFPPILSLSTRPNNLPHQLTSFIGREQDILALKKLKSSTRLITLTGPGGCGKTRLGLQFAAETLERSTEGAWLVELASLTNPSLVPQAIAGVLGLREATGRATSQVVVDYLKDKKILMLLDNCEHLLEASALMADAIARHCPGVQVVATSREALRIAGEQIYRVPSLAAPSLQQPQTPDSISRFDAVKLFIDRAILVSQYFRITNGNAPALASICHRLDGAIRN